jgi:hypothetical protein
VTFAADSAIGGAIMVLWMPLSQVSVVGAFQRVVVLLSGHIFRGPSLPD